MKRFSILHRMRFPRLMIEHTKHGKYYYYISSLDDLYDCAFNILYERNKQDYYIPITDIPDTFDEFVFKKYNMTMLQITRLPESVFLEKNNSPHHNGWKDTLKILKRDYDESVEYNKIVEMINTTVENRDKKLGCQLLFDYLCDGEYDKIEFEPFENLR